MLRTIARGLRGERGQDFLEFAIIVPIFVLLLVAMVDFGRVFSTWLQVTHLAREGARYAAVGGSQDEIRNYLMPMTTGLTIEREDILVDPPDPAARTAGDAVTVTVPTSVELLSAIIADVIGLGNPLSVTGSAQMRYEGPWISGGMEQLPAVVGKTAQVRYRGAWL